MNRIMLVLLFLTLSTSAISEKLILAADEWCPHNCEPNSERPGYIIEIINAIFVPLGYDIEYRTLPWTRAIKQARTNSANGIIGAIPVEAPDFIYPSENAGIVINKLYTLPESNWLYRSTIDLNSVRLGAIMDYSYGSAITEYIKEHQNDFERVSILMGDDARSRLLLMLNSKRIDVLVEDEAVLNHLNLRSKKPDLRIAGIASTDKVYVAFSPNSPNSILLAKAFDTGINQLRSSGKLNELLSEYGLVDWK